MDPLYKLRHVSNLPFELAVVHALVFKPLESGYLIEEQVLFAPGTLCSEALLQQFEFGDPLGHGLQVLLHCSNGI